MENNSIDNIKVMKALSNKKYYEKLKMENPDKIKQKFICSVCNGKYTYYNKNHHEKTNKHLKFVK